MVAGDFNGATRVDLVTAASYSGGISVLHGLPTGGFGSPERYSAASYPYTVAAGDFDGNGGLDLAVVDREGDSIGVLYNTIPEPGTGALLGVMGAGLLGGRRRGRRR